MMKAAVLEKPGGLKIKSIGTPPCPEGGVLVNVKACGICRSDYKMVKSGHRALVYPRILGHEITGVVEESRSDRFHKGDRIQVAPGLRCGSCSYCKAGADNQCCSREIIGFTTDGGFAEQIAIPLSGKIIGGLSIVSDHMDFDLACLAEPVACCINAQNKTDTRKRDTVLIMGAGPLGLMNGFIARHCGAEKIIMAEPNKERQKQAESLVADTVCDPEGEGFIDQIIEETKGLGVDVMIFAFSNRGPDSDHLNVMARGGRVSVFSGVSPFETQHKVDWNSVHYKELNISGAYGCSAGQNREAIDLMAAGRFEFEKLITRRVKLNDLEAYIKDADPDRDLKTVVEV